MPDPNPRTFFRSQADGMSQRFPEGDFGDIAAAPMANAGSRLAFLRRVYGWMFAAVVATIFGAGIAVKSGAAEAMLTWSFLPRLLLVFAWIGAMFLVQKVRHIPTVNVVAFAGYSLLTGFVLSTLIWFAMALAHANGEGGATYLLQAGGLTLVSFGSISAYAFFTKRDFSFLRGFLMVGSIVLLGALLIGFFVESTAYQLAISVAGVLLFSGFILFDTQKVLKTYPDNEHVAGAMTLYLDFINLFIYILRIILIIASGGRRD